MTSLQRQLRRCDDATALAQHTAEAFVRVAQASVAARGRCMVALAGGSTPKAAYALLASPAYRERVPWQQLHVFWGDERHVPPDHAESNYRMAHDAMLAHVPIPAAHIHRMPTEQEAQQAADSYAATLQQAFHVPDGTWPRFDLILLGMGPDGHTASLFPGTAAVHEQSSLVVAPWVEKFHTFRVTLTPPVLCHAAHVVFAVGGADKAETLQQVLGGPYLPDRYPAQVVQPTHGTVLWLVDQAAARLLSWAGSQEESQVWP